MAGGRRCRGPAVLGVCFVEGMSVQMEDTLVYSDELVSDQEGSGVLISR